MDRPTLRYSLILLIFGIAVALSATSFRLDNHPRASSSPAVVAQDKQCQEWEHKEGDNCVRDPDAYDQPSDHTPGPGEKCWVQCLCRQGQYPADQSCSPCSKVGMVCKPL
jgi:hypothetical protein